jgi:thioredoxin 1
MADVKSITDATFKEEIANGPVIVDFWAPWCQPCKQIAKELDILAAKYPQVRIVKLNVDENQQNVRELNITSIPALVFFPKSGAPLGVMGMASAKTIASKFELDTLVGTR